MLLLVDNYDSFTYNLKDYFEQLNCKIRVVRNNESDELLFSDEYKGVVLSPGPGVPSNAGKLNQVIKYYYKSVPIIGICLGHQALGEFFGAKLQKADIPMHGKVSKISVNNSALYKGLKSQLEVVRYHSLVLHELPSSLVQTALTDKNEIMSFEHKKLPIVGIQYHPEAFLTKEGIKILQNWLTFNKLVN